MFLFCHFGENVSTQFSDINDALAQNDWYLFSNEKQNMLLMVKNQLLFVVLEIFYSHVDHSSKWVILSFYKNFFIWKNKSLSAKSKLVNISNILFFFSGRY